MCVARFVLSASGTSALFLSVSFVSSHFHPNQNPISHFILISPLPLPIIISPVCVPPCLLLSPSFSSWSLSTVISFLLHIISLFFYPISTLFNPFSQFYSVFPLHNSSMHVYFTEIKKFTPPRIVETSFWAYPRDLKHWHWWQVYACWCMLTKITANAEVCKREREGKLSFQEWKARGRERKTSGNGLASERGVKSSYLAKGTQENIMDKIIAIQAQ